MLPTTTSVLLASLKESESGSTWRMFDERYRPVLYSFARNLGLGEEDARDVAQDTLVAFLEEYRQGRYDRDRGRLRSWLFSLVRSRAARSHREMCKKQDWRGESVLEGLVGEDESREMFEAEWRRAVIREALSRLEDTRMDSKTLRAFEMVALEERSVEDVARELEMTKSSVYVARFRALEHLRSVLQHVEQDFER